MSIRVVLKTQDNWVKTVSINAALGTPEKVDKEIQGQPTSFYLTRLKDKTGKPVYRAKL
jgi:hypothetical protein